ncbi:class I SAM-dependent methyltransferase [Pelagibacterium limicola]|uniref:class I SAM-dependent methyltransferase n=1 Tax=Pelagibacterium limicola TaxID=2791022 RepID=UPI001FECAE31
MPVEERLIIDFVGGAVGYRLRQREGRGQALPKAIGLGKGAPPFIVDATAGMGRDAFLLASLGAHVTLIERNTAVHVALADAMERARKTSPEFSEIIGRMTLLCGDSRELLVGLAPEVVLVDPMHPPRGKSALVKKEMRVLREYVGDDPDQRELIETALNAARQRVVLKWPLRAKPLGGLRKPSHQIIGKTTRYDVFMIS